MEFVEAFWNCIGDGRADMFDVILWAYVAMCPLGALALVSGRI